MVQLVALAICPAAGAAADALATPAPKLEAAPVAPFEAVLDAALAAYNNSNSAQFLTHFAQHAVPPPQPALFTALFEGVYKRDYGKYLSKKPLPRETSVEAARALVVFEATFERHKVKVSANFVHEQNLPKIVQLRMEPM